MSWSSPWPSVTPAAACPAPSWSTRGRATPTCSTASSGYLPAERSRLSAPCRLPGRVEQHLDRLATDGREHVLHPPVRSGERHRQLVLGEPAHVGALQRVRRELAAGRLAEENERVERDARESE